MVPFGLILGDTYKMSLIRKLAYGTATAALLMAAPAAVYAQQTTSQVRGVILDGSGSPVSGAQITIVHTGTGSTDTTSTNANGNFFVSGMRVGGPYTITVSSAGYDDVVSEGIMLAAGQPETFNAVLGGSADTIVVMGSAVRQELQLNGGVGSVFGAEDLAEIPSIQRDVISSFLSDPLVTSGELSGRSRANGSISVAGQDPRLNGFYIDGLAQGNDFGLDQGLFPTLRQPVSIDWVQEASIQASDYSVLSGGFTGGVVNLVTKSGTNEFDGSLYRYYRDQSMVGDQAFGNEVNQSGFEESEWGFNIGGPIIEDRLFFFAGYEDFTNTAPLNFDFGSLDTQVFDIIRNVMQTTYNYDPGDKGNTSVDELAERTMLRLDWDINNDHRLTVSWQGTEDNLLTNTGTFRFPTNYYNLSSTQDFYRAELNSQWTNNFSTTFRYATKEYIRGQNSLGDTSATGTSFGEFIVNTDEFDPYWAANGLDGAALLGSNREFRLGPDVFRHHNAYSDERTVFYGQGDLILGDHQIQFGAEFEQFDLFNVFGQYSRGQFEFDSIQNLVDQIADVSYINAQSNNSDDVIADWGFEKTTLFFQDSWQVTPRLNVNGGFRYESYTQDDVPPAPEMVISGDGTTLLSFQDVYGFSGTDNLDGLDIFQPRFGFRYDHSDRLTISGGVGIFSGGSPQVWASNNFTSATFAAFGFGPIAGVTGTEVPASVQGVIGGGIGLPPGFNAVQNVDIFDPNFEIPRTLRASLRAEYEMDLDRWGMGDGYRVSATMLYGDQQKQLIWRNLAFDRADMAAHLGVAPDGRVIYPDLGDIPLPSDPDNLDGDPGTNGSEFNVPDAFVMTNRDGGSSWTFALQVAKEYDNGISFDASYANTSSEDLVEYGSSRAISAWRGIVGTDRNNASVGTSSNEVEHKFAIRFSYDHEFIRDLNTNITFLGYMQSGQPFSFGYDVGSRNPAFGRANGGSPRDGADLFYVPILNADATGFADSRVEFETANDEALMLDFIRTFGLAQYQGQIVPRNSEQSSWTQRWDMRFQQELPGFGFADRYVGDNRLKLVVDVENVANLLNDEWGTQLNRGGSFGRVNVADVDLRHVASGEVLTDNEPGEFCNVESDCRYIYGDVFNFDTDSLFRENANNSVYRIRVGLRYEF